MRKNILILAIFSLAIILNSLAINTVHIGVDLMTEKIELPATEVIEEDTSQPPKVAVLEYHNFGSEDGRWTRSPETFYNDLLWLYNNDYRPVTVQEFLKMEFQIEPGKKPVIISFDDASEGQFRYLEDGSIDPDSAVGVMDQFVQDYPDFGNSATFFILPYSFGQAEYIDDKLKYLVETGRELGSHTFGHEDLEIIDGGTIEWTLSEAERYLEDQLGQPYALKSLAYPLGHYPDGELFGLIKEGANEGHTYKIDAAFLVGAHPTLMPDNEDFDAYKIPRIQTIDEEWERWFNRTPGETEKSEEKPNYRPFIVGAENSVEKEEPPVIEEPVDDGDQQGEVIEEVLTEEMPIEEPEPLLPYETCKPFDFEQTPIGETLWKKFKYQASKVQLNKIPSEFTYRDGKFYYTITGEEGSLSEKFFPISRHYRVSDFKDALIAANPESDFEPEEEVIIPDIPKFAVNHPVKANQPWGIYLTGYYSVSDEGKRLIGELKNRGGQLIVFDVKEIDGYVFYPSEVPLVKETGADQHIVIPNLKNYVRYWHDQGIYLAARVVIFKDINLSRSRPDLAIHNTGGGLWSNREGVVWVDPSNEETQNYVLGLTEELALAGVDEIQFDYIRFPTLGPVNSTKYNFDEDNMEKYEVIRNFIVRVHDQLKPYDTKLSLDVYGVIAWNEGYDSRSTGQKMECLGPYIDVVYPMVYPSHFGPGFAGFDSPGDHPYYFVAESIKLFKHYLEGTNTEIRPWLQAFAWGVSNYGQWYVDEQVKASHDNGVYGYSLWNASNVYF